jgi:hypothetical protein
MDTPNHFVPLLLQDKTTEYITIIDVDEPRPSTKTTARHVRPEKRTRTQTTFDKPKQSNKRMRLPTCTSSPKYIEFPPLSPTIPLESFIEDATRSQNYTAEDTIDPGFDAANTDRPTHKENAGIESLTEDTTLSQDDTTDRSNAAEMVTKEISGMQKLNGRFLDGQVFGRGSANRHSQGHENTKI